jgi:CBS domain-containing protein
MTVDQIAREDVVTATEETTTGEVVDLMAEEDVGSVVVESDGDPVGIVTDRQIALGLADEPDIAKRRVERVMTTSVVTVHRDDGIAETIETMQSSSVRRLPVVDDDGELVGILSIDDIVVMLTDEFDDLQDVLKSQSPRF